MLPIRIFPMPPWLWALIITAMGLVLLLEWGEFSLAQGAAAPLASPNSAGPPQEPSPTQQPLQELPDGHYQLCSEPDPQDWRDGAGACFDFSKEADAVQGYYGYPHSSEFVCLRGEIAQPSFVVAEAQLFVWGESMADALPSGRFAWDREERLTLEHAEAVRQLDEEVWPIYRVLFRTAELNTDRFYRYPSPRMKSHLELCDWRTNEWRTNESQEAR